MQYCECCKRSSEVQELAVIVERGERADLCFRREVTLCKSCETIVRNKIEQLLKNAEAGVP